MFVRGRTACASCLLRHARRGLSSEHTGALTLGIRKEDPSRIWERRCPLTPEAVHELVRKDGVRVLVQPCDRRVFPLADFVAAGAEAHPTLAPAHITVGIKETPLDTLLTSPAPPLSGGPVPRTHLMFSHTIKAQPYNMPLLARFLGPEQDLLPRLVDYELLTGDDGKRTVGFGWFAGVAGALESLSALAHAHLAMGVASPLLYTPRPHTHPDLASLRRALHGVGALITAHGTPPSLGPLVLGLTGNGQVAQGVLSMLDELPIQRVEAKDLPALVSNPDADLHKIYLVHALPDAYLSRTDGAAYTRADYYADPSAFRSTFATGVAPYLSLLLNCAGWAPSFPRLMTNAQLGDALARAREVGLGRFAAVGDISCDIEGGLEFLTHSTTLSEPVYTAHAAADQPGLPGVQMMAVDILPAALPQDASAHFSSVLRPYVRALVREYRGQPAEGDEERKAREGLVRATVAREGRLTPSQEWLMAPVNAWRESAKLASAGLQGGRDEQVTPAAASATPARKKRVLLLGSGMVAGPTVDEISKRSDVELVIVSASREEAERLIQGKENVSAVQRQISDPAELAPLVEQADVVISLLPVSFHPEVAKLCVAAGKHMVTASYISPAMASLNQSAVDADVLLLNEIGLDPGIDHCSAIKLLEELKQQGKEVVSFVSFCGGLPAPQHAEVPLGYKFSWSPKGVLLATLNGARFDLGGKRYDIAEKDLLSSAFPSVPISKVLQLEGIPNRDSSPYRETYGLPTDIRTLLRGTLRYTGYSSLVQTFKSIGLLSTKPLAAPLTSWSKFIPETMAAAGILAPNTKTDALSITHALADVAGSGHDAALDALSWLGVIPGSAGAGTDMPHVPSGAQAPLDLLAALLAHKLRYGPHERDLVVLHHELVARGADGGQEEVHTSQLVAYGTPAASAMSRTVGLPVAFAALRVLDGEVRGRGVMGPTEKVVYEGVLASLAQVGLGMREGVLRGPSLESHLVRQVTSR